MKPSGPKFIHTSTQKNNVADVITKRARAIGLTKTCVCPIPSWICNMVDSDSFFDCPRGSLIKKKIMFVTFSVSLGSLMSI